MKKNLKMLTAAALVPLCFHGAARAAGTPVSTAAVTVAVDPRVELMSVIFRLAGNREYNRCRIPSYDADVEKHFGPFKDHPAVKFAAELKKKNGVSYDAVMTMAIHMTDTVTLGEKVPFDPKPQAMDDRWNTADAGKFLELARGFVKDTGFNEFYAAHKGLYDLAVERMRGTLEKDAHLEWFDGFFGPAKDADFHVVLGMLNGGGSYGPRVVLPDGREEIYSVMGVWKLDDKGLPVFPASVVSTLVHEFTHSYTNPIVDHFRKDLERSGAKLFSLTEEKMRSQAYGEWDTLMYESLNRACELRYDAAFYGPAEVKKAAAREISNGFYWVPGLAGVLAEYDAAPRKYKDLYEFFPHIAAYFNGYAAHAEENIKAELERKKREMEVWREKGPRVTAFSPENGAADVPADVKEIRITFDRPMMDGYSMVQVQGPDRYPKSLGGSGFDAEKKVFTMPVELQPGRDYVLGVNSGEYTGFQGADGVPLYPVVYKFSTKAGS